MGKPTPYRTSTIRVTPSASSDDGLPDASEVVRENPAEDDAMEGVPEAALLPRRAGGTARSAGDLSARERRAWRAAASVCDPEVPVLTIEDLGVLRDVHEAVDGAMVVTITPTYSGCPAMDLIAVAVDLALHDAGFANVRVEHALSPAWTTDWMSAEGRQKLKAYGIAPPKAGSSRRALFGEEEIACPRCESVDTSKISEFGSTACKALWRCNACGEPFDYFKCH
jgi:ring-1,2-phenylacetyl-CoA epoxidase subunit PaaD